MAFETAEETSRLYEVDALDMKLAAVGKMLKAAKTAEQRVAVVKQACAVLEEAAGKDKFELRRQLGQQLAVEARKTRDNELIKSVAAAEQADQGAGGRLPAVPRGPGHAEVPARGHRGEPGRGKVPLLDQGAMETGPPVSGQGRRQGVAAGGRDGDARAADGRRGPDQAGRRLVGLGPIASLRRSGSNSCCTPARGMTRRTGR